VADPERTAEWKWIVEHDPGLASRMCDRIVKTSPVPQSLLDAIFYTRSVRYARKGSDLPSIGRWCHHSPKRRK